LTQKSNYLKTAIYRSGGSGRYESSRLRGHRKSEENKSRVLKLPWKW